MHLCANSCICTTASSHTLSLRQPFGADLQISIATIARVGGGDIKKIDCHKKKATVQQKEGDCKRGVTQGAAPPVSAAATSCWGSPLQTIKQERMTPAGYQTLGDKDGEIGRRDGKEGGDDRELLQRALLGFKHLMCCRSSLFILPSPPRIFSSFFPMQKPPLHTPLISPLPPCANTLTPPN